MKIALRVEVRILDARVATWGFPHQGSEAAAGFDLFACLDHPLLLAPGTPAVLIGTGLAIHIADPGWCGIVAPRSGLGHRGLVLGNTIGVIDADYTGEVLVSAWNRNLPSSDAAITIEPGDRIAQLLFVPVVHPQFAVVDSFSQTSARGEGGFGSSGQGREP